MRDALPIIGMVVLGLVFVLGIMIFGAAMESAYVETNQTAENLTLIPYEVQSAWWGGAAIIVMIIALAFALFMFRR